VSGSISTSTALPKLLVYDEKNSFSNRLFEDWAARGYQVSSVPAEQITSLLAQDHIDVVLLNLKGAPSENLSQLITEIKEIDENVPIICLTPHSHVEAAVRLMKQGVYDFIQLPIEPEVLHHLLERAVHLYRLSQRVFYLERQKDWKGEFWGIVGASASMQENFRTIAAVAKSHATVLVLGESGTGKELVAKAIHSLSDRSKNKFIDLNCGAIPKELLENELFGHERGSFTGADRRYIGSFERANGGTLFLDEICEMDLALQVKLLRVLQERSFTRIGGTDKIDIDVRFIAATNRNIQEDVNNGRFREDLYYRLNVVPILVPPLRERPEDIPLLSKHFLELYSARNNKIFFEFQPEALEALCSYSWPGNVRELQNVIERVVVLHNDSQVKLKHLPSLFHSLAQKKNSQQFFSSLTNSESQKIIPLEELERLAIEQAMKLCHGSVSEVAKALEVGQATLYRKIQKYKMER
jgi:DNA-binding NtrC family response regulator